MHTQLRETTLGHTHARSSFTRPADLLPELSDCAGQVGGVRQTVVGEAFVCVPGVVTALPRKLLHTTHADVKATRGSSSTGLVQIQDLQKDSPRLVFRPEQKRF